MGDPVTQWPVCVGCGTQLSLNATWTESSDHPRLVTLGQQGWCCPVCKTSAHTVARLIELSPISARPQGGAG